MAEIDKITGYTGEDDRYVRGSGLLKLERITKYKDPTIFSSKEEHIRGLFEEIQAHSASDIYIHDGKPIAVLINGKMYAASHRTITKTEAQWLLGQIAGNTALATINAQIPINTTFGLFDSLDREKKNLTGHRTQNTYRVNAVGTMSNGGPSFQIVMRAIPSTPYRFDAIGLQEWWVKLCCPPKGIVLIAGVTGSGKSTTLSSIIRYILENNTAIKGNIITHEEPIEFTYENIKTNHSVVVQSQIPENFKGFGAANREAMRRKPAAILVGELRDAETISSAVEASLTGHPVFGTVHAGAITEIIPRLIAQYPNEKSKALYDIISTCAMLVAQRLIPKTDGKLMAVKEHLFLTESLRKELLKIDDPLEVNRRIQVLMDNGSMDEKAHASLTFAKQGEMLLQRGIINAEGMVYLTGEYA